MTAALRPEEKWPLVAYAPETIMTMAQVADWLQVSLSTVEHSEIPSLPHMPGNRIRRYSAGMVLAFLEGRLDAYLRRST